VSETVSDLTSKWSITSE